MHEDLVPSHLAVVGDGGTYFLRVVRGALLKGQSVADMWRELAALLAFVCVVTALAMARYRRTLD